MEDIYLGLGFTLNGAALAVTIALIIMLSLTFIFSENIAKLKNVPGGSLISSSLRVFTIVLSIIFIVTILNNIALIIISS